MFKCKLERAFFPVFSPLCSCWHSILQGTSRADPVCDLQKTQPNRLQQPHITAPPAWGTAVVGVPKKPQQRAQSWPGHLGEWLPTQRMIVTPQKQGKALGHRGAKRNPGTSGWGSSVSVCTCVLCVVVSKEMVEKILGEGTQFYLTGLFLQPSAKMAWGA